MRRPGLCMQDADFPSDLKSTKLHCHFPPHFQMRRYIRHFVPGGTYFFTVVTHHRAPIFDNAANVAALGEALRRTRRRRPFDIDAIVVLPDHLHTLWHLPDGDSDFSNRWRDIKKHVTRLLGATPGRVWQNRFWEHHIRDEDDWRRHMDYIHYNPVRHGHVLHPADWPWSSFRQCVERGWYSADWGETEPEDIRLMELE